MNIYKNVIRLGKSWKQLLMDSLQNLHLLCIKFIKNNVSSQHQCCYLTGLTSERDTILAVNMPFKQTEKPGRALVSAPSAAEIHESAGTEPVQTFLMQIQSYTWWHAFKTSISSKRPEAILRLHESCVSADKGICKSSARTHQICEQRCLGNWWTLRTCSSVETLTVNCNGVMWEFPLIYKQFLERLSLLLALLQKPML